MQEWKTSGNDAHNPDPYVNVGYAVSSWSKYDLIFTSDKKTKNHSVGFNCWLKNLRSYFSHF